jgi:hypothetical protein
VSNRDNKTVIAGNRTLIPRFIVRAESAKIVTTKGNKNPVNRLENPGTELKLVVRRDWYFGKTGADNGSNEGSPRFR